MWLPIGLCLKKKGKKGKKEKKTHLKCGFGGKKEKKIVQKDSHGEHHMVQVSKKKKILSPNKPLDDHTITKKKSYITKKNERKKNHL